MLSRLYKLTVCIVLVWILCLCGADGLWASSSSDTSTSSKTATTSKSKKSIPPPKAEPPPPPIHPWKNTNIQFGGTMNTGNSEVLNLNSTFNLNYERGSWGDTGRANFQYGTRNSEQITQIISVTNQGNYYFNGKKENFIFLKGSYLRDWFSPYQYQSSVSSGYGRDLYKTDTFRWSIQAGPGYRFARARSENAELEDSFIINTGTKLSWKPFSNLSFTEDFSNEYGSTYDYIHSVFEVQNTLYGHLALGVTLTVDYYSKLPPNATFTELLDTTTAVNVVYNF